MGNIIDFGRVVPKGRLPVFSVETEDDAKLLISSCCPMQYDGTYVARELAEEQTLDNLYAFSDRLAEAWTRIEEGRKSRCKRPAGKKRGRP